MASSPEQCDTWYTTPRGRWIAGHEFALLTRLRSPKSQATLLDVGTGTGHFARRFSGIGLKVAGLDPESPAVAYAASKSANISYVQGDAHKLPFADGGFDYCTVVTSLCFIADAGAAVREMWRVARCGIVLGVLYRQSLLHRPKAGCGAYADTRWDDAGAVVTARLIEP